MQVKIISPTGLVIKQVPLNELSTVVDMQSLDAGVYIIQVSNNAGESMNYRMIKK